MTTRNTEGSTMQNLPQAEQSEVQKFLETIIEGWDELDKNPLIEIRSISPSRQVSVSRFATDWLGEAVDHVLAMNAAKQNVYVCVNPVDGEAHIQGGKGAKDTDILAAFFCFADADSNDGMQNILNFAGPKFTMSVKTGTTPSVRGHAYWRLEEPCRNLDAWRDVQRSIAASLGTDPAVINPSRIMRIGGTVSWPNADKQAKGYVPELVTFRTEFSTDRDPVPFERMMRAFPPTKGVTSYDTSYTFGGQSGFHIDIGQQAMDRALAEQNIAQGVDWHNNIIRLVASYVSKGLTDSEIHALTDRFTMGGYTVDDTRREVQQAIDGARDKGWTPKPDQAAERLQQSAAAISFDAEPPEQPVEAKAEWPTPVGPINELMLPKRRWIYGRHYIRGFVSVTASAPGIGKSSQLIVEALAIATGKPLLGEPVHERAPVWVVNLEDDLGEMQLRLAAAMNHYGLTHADIDGYFFMDGEDTIDIVMAAETRDGLTQNDALLAAMTRKVKDNKIAVLALDPFVSSHLVNENSNGAIQAVVAMFRQLAREAECSVEIVHHVRKGASGEDATVDSVRGAGSLIGAARSARVVNRVSAEDAARVGVPEADAIGLFRVDTGKSNLAAPADKATYRRMIGVQLANEEFVGVCVDYKLPDLFDGITAADAMKVQAAVGKAAEGEPCRHSVQSKNWVGLTVGEVLGLDAEEADKARVKAIVKKWIETDVLRVEQMPDKKQGRDVPCVVVGTWISRDEAGLL